MVSDKNKLLCINFRKFTLTLLSILCQNKMLIKYFCKVVHIQNYTVYIFFHRLICILFHVKTNKNSKWCKSWVRKIMMVLRPQQGNLGLVFRLSLILGRDLNNLKTCLRFPCLGLNPIIDSFNLQERNLPDLWIYHRLTFL